jgi:hypothetical protein
VALYFVDIFFVIKVQKKPYRFIDTAFFDVYVCLIVWARIANPRYPLTRDLLHFRAIGYKIGAEIIRKEKERQKKLGKAA